MESESVDLGDNHTCRLRRWPESVSGEGTDWHGLAYDHVTPDGKQCQGYITLDVPAMREMWPTVERWTVDSWEPLTLSPSLLCSCGDHGFIKQGAWVRA